QNSAYNREPWLRLPARDLSPRSYPRPVPRPMLKPTKRKRVSRPPDEIWGRYNNYRSNGVAISAVIHVAVIGLLLSGVFVTHQITERVTRQTVTLIGPSRESYALPVAKTVISGGGGGRDDEPNPTPTCLPL